MSGTNQLLPFMTAREFAESTPAEVPWLVRRYVARGSLHEVVGRAKAAGKTTLIAYLIAAVLDGRPFLDQPTEKTPVVFLTEQPPTSLREVIERAGLADRDDLHLLLWRDARVATWPTIVATAVAECDRVGATLLVVDTLPAFAGIAGDSENDAGAALAAIEPLQTAAADGLAVIVVRHERKGGGEVGESGRGSTAFTGSVDVVLRLMREPNAPRPSVRLLNTLSRFDETPPEIVIELKDDGYVVLGDQAAVAFIEARDAVRDVLPEMNGLTIAEIQERAGGKRTTDQAALTSLIADGEAERTGSGKRGDPYRYRRVDVSAKNISGPARTPAEARTHAQPFLSAGRPPIGGRASAAENTTAAPGDDDLEPEAIDDLIATAFPEPTPLPSTIACRDYRAHQSRHRRERDGWVCEACQASGTPA